VVIPKKDKDKASTFDSIIRNLEEMKNQALGKAKPTSTILLDLLMKFPDTLTSLGKAGKYLQDLREVAGLSIEDLARIINLDNPDELRDIEEGRQALTLDMLYRLGSFYARNDPFAFMIDFSREHVPILWQVLKISGIDKLVITLERELKFINIYRARDKAQKLDNQQFQQLLSFTEGAFNLAMDFVEQAKPPTKKSDTKAQPKRTPSSKTSKR
jgi:transcriptional regulator with XRE-family HTH domain